MVVLAESPNSGSPDLALVPPIRLGAILRAIREQHGWTPEQVAEATGNRFEAAGLLAIEGGARRLSESELVYLSSVYGLATSQLVPQRMRLVVDLDGGVISSGTQQSDLGKKDTGQRRILERYLDLVYVLRGRSQGGRIPLRDDDVAVLATALQTSPTEVRAELVSLMEAVPRKGFGRFLKAGLIIPAAGILVGVTGIGSLVLEPEVELAAANTAVEFASASVADVVDEVEPSVAVEAVEAADEDPAAAVADLASIPTRLGGEDGHGDHLDDGHESPAETLAPTTDAPPPAPAPTAVPTSAAPATSAPVATPASTAEAPAPPTTAAPSSTTAPSPTSTTATPTTAAPAPATTVVPTTSTSAPAATTTTAAPATTTTTAPAPTTTAPAPTTTAPPPTTTAPAPTTTAPAPTTSTTEAQYLQTAAVPHHQAVGQGALERISYDWQTKLPGWQIKFMPARAGYLGGTMWQTKTIEVYIRDSHTVDQVAVTLAHELGHAVDIELNSEDDREAWRAERGIRADMAWWGESGASDYATPLGDFAESFAAWQVGSYDFRSQLGGIPDGGDISLLAALADA